MTLGLAVRQSVQPGVLSGKVYLNSRHQTKFASLAANDTRFPILSAKCFFLQKPPGVYRARDKSRRREGCTSCSRLQGGGANQN